MPKKIDLINQKFGRLVVIREATKEEKEGRPGAYWICNCDCGNTVIKNGQGLRKGETTSCGCDVKEKLKARPPQNFIDETGKTYGRLTVLYRDYEKEKLHPNRGSTYWKCKCECGNEVSVLRSCLVNKTTQSCGCLRKEKAQEQMRIKSSNNYINEIGNKYGKLLVIQKITNNNSAREGAKWLCRCDCGNFKEAFGVDLRKGTTSSCGCLGKSKGEVKIEYLLKENNIEFAKEYTVIINNKKLRFDFAIFSNSQLIYLIEYDGQQHFMPSDLFGGENYLEYIQNNDLLKNNWCEKNNILLIRIPYTHYTKLIIEDLIPETSQFLLR